MSNRAGLIVAIVLLSIPAGVVLVSATGCSRRTYAPHEKSEAASPPFSFRSNGERIYFTLTDERGERISFQGGPPWLSMHGGSCADCHGSDGRGGKQVMMGTAVPADIRYSVLTAKEHPAGGEHADHPPYTDRLIKRAITEGLDPAGGRLDQTMPRFTMPEQDLNDLVDYLKQLDGKRAE
ncbi:MAG: cytochrome c [Thermoanaerobaculia bacterium]